ncbi:MAG: 4-hydroxy-tetrahydrodipicolinate synthase [Gemmatimonadetes bacterium]|nr:4-hydroxy-tetrahydrodipicolinate synthase [Gemmatimonadota bacterium]
MATDISRFRGVGPALVTPMHEDGRLDLATFAEHVRFCLDGGVHFLVPCGTTGESATMDADEQVRVIEATLEAADGRAPVVAGAGTNDTKGACARAKAAAAAGADAILSVSPYYNKPTQEGLYRHYVAVADAAGVPVFVYNVPGRTGSNVAPETLFRLAEHDNIVGVKEASGSIDQVMTILRGRPDGFLVLSGEDHLTFPLMALGGDGLISVAANEVPGPVSDLVEAALEGRWDEARTLHFRLLPLMRANFIETNPIPVKTALAMMGRFEAWFRPPMCELGDAARTPLREALELAGVTLADEGDPPPDHRAAAPGATGRRVAESGGRGSASAGAGAAR